MNKKFLLLGCSAITAMSVFGALFVSNANMNNLKKAQGETTERTLVVNSDNIQQDTRPGHQSDARRGVSYTTLNNPIYLDCSYQFDFGNDDHFAHLGPSSGIYFDTEITNILGVTVNFTWTGAGTQDKLVLQFSKALNAFDGTDNNLVSGVEVTRTAEEIEEEHNYIDIWAFDSFNISSIIIRYSC